MLVTENDLNKIVKEARTRKGSYFFIYSKSGKFRGTIPIKIKKFKKIGFIIDMDFPFDLEQKNIDEISLMLNKILLDIKTKGFKEKLKIGRGHITGAFYLGDENDVISYILNSLQSYI